MIFKKVVHHLFNVILLIFNVLFLGEKGLNPFSLGLYLFSYIFSNPLRKD